MKPLLVDSSAWIQAFLYTRYVANRTAVEFHILYPYFRHKNNKQHRNIG